MEYKIDATNKKMGRVATEAAVVLMGKDKADYAPNKTPDVKVIIENSSKVDATNEKLKGKEYRRYTGYPGGLRSTSAYKLKEKKGYSELLERAVYGMLPSNRLRKVMMSKLTITE